MRMLRRLSIVGLAPLICLPLFAQPTEDPYVLPPGHVVPGKPWTKFIPDPGKFAWPTTGSRPGYRYRGMLPMQQRFYDYIQQKRARRLPLNSAEEATIRYLIMSRRWPEPPRPNPFWASFMRILRNRDTLDLNLRQELFLYELKARGLMPVDIKPPPGFDNLRNYLNSGPFQPRGFLQRVAGRVEPWMDVFYSGYGLDMRPSAPAGNVFPGEPFNGMQITYNVSGATVGDPTDSFGFSTGRSFKGVLSGGALAVSGRVRVGGYGADVVVSVWAGSKKDEKKFYVENTGSSGNPTSFSVSVPVAQGIRAGGFAIRMDGRYSMGGGHRGLCVTGDFAPTAAEIAAEKAAADAKWRAEVEETLKRLGYQNTPEGRELEAMRLALAGEDAAWKAFVDRRLKELGADTSPQAQAYNRLQQVLQAGGQAWSDYVAKQLGTGGGTAGGGTTGGGTTGGGAGTGTAYQPPPNVGTVPVGTGVSDGTIENASGTFTAPPKVSCVTNYANLPENSTAVVVWTRDGQEVTRSQRTISGTGWVSFSLMNSSGLTPGTYVVTITVGSTILGRKSFKVLPKP